MEKRDEKQEIVKKPEEVGTGKIDVLRKYSVSGKMLSQSEIDMLVKRYKSESGMK